MQVLLIEIYGFFIVDLADTGVPACCRTVHPPLTQPTCQLAWWIRMGFGSYTVPNL